ncbi:MAG: protein-disulfide reductase DsbD domain-containing protein, partial [Parasphingorhabdus sp.]
MTFDFRIFGVMLAFAALTFAPSAEAQNRLGNSELNVPATLVAESQKVIAGQNVTLAFVMEPKPTWHGYWENPGDAGIGMSFDWTLPAGVTAGKPQFQVPDTLLIAGIMNYVYKGDYAVLVNLTLSDKVRPGPLPISVKSEWLSCTDEICVPEQDELSITLQVVDKDAAVVLDKRFEGFRAALPRPLGSEARFAVTDNLFRLSVPLPSNVEIDKPYFFILEDGIVDYGAPQTFSRDGDRLILETGARGDQLDTISGVLKIGDHTGFLISATKGEVAMTGLPLAKDGPESENITSLLFLALGGAILGGLLLNLMPCVFPILSIKIL